MIEIRNLMREELLRLLKEAPEHETKFLREMEEKTGEKCYDFFKRKSIVMQGLIIDGRPIYIAAIMQGNGEKYVFWTIVTSDVKDPVALCKYSKRELNKWLRQFGTIYATMPKGNVINQKWTEWLGFSKIEEDLDTITYKLGV